MDLTEKTLSEKLIYEGKTINLKIKKVQLPNGKTIDRDIVEHPGAVAIVPFIKEDEIILIEQFRKPVDRVIYEIPAGKFKKGETPLECGTRELEEETGFKADNLEYLGKMVMSPGYSNQVVHLCKATGLYKGSTNFDEDEFIDVKTYKIDDVKKMVRDGEVIDAKTIAALAFI